MTLEQRIARLELQLDKLSKGTPIRFGEAPPPELDLQGGQDNGEPDKLVAPDPRFSQTITQTMDMSDMLKAAGARDWEILEFRATKMHGGPEVLLDRKRKRNGFYTYTEDPDYNETLEELLEGEFSVADGSFTIHSVRRLSDNTTWTVGEVCSVDTLDRAAPIKKIELQEGRLMVQFVAFWHDLGLLTKVDRKPLFTTADGVEVYEGDTVYILWVNGKDQYTGRISMEPAREVDLDHLLKRSYSTESAAQAAYTEWLWSQPVLCLNDVVDDPQHASHLVALVNKKLSFK